MPDSQSFHERTPLRTRNQGPEDITAHPEGGFIQPEEARRSFALSDSQWRQIDALLKQRRVEQCGERGWPLEAFSAALCTIVEELELH